MPEGSNSPPSFNRPLLQPNKSVTAQRSKFLILFLLQYVSPAPCPKYLKYNYNLFDTVSRNINIILNLHKKFFIC